MGGEWHNAGGLDLMQKQLVRGGLNLEDVSDTRAVGS